MGYSRGLRSWLCSLVLWPAAAAALPAAAAPAPLAELSAVTRQRLERAAASLERTALGRRLIAETLEVPRRESDQAAGADGVRCLRREKPVLVLGPRRLEALSGAELDLALVRELARARADLPWPMPEEDMAAYQAELEYALERCGQDEAFALRLGQALRSVRSQEAAALSEQQRVQAFLPEAGRIAAPLLKTPRGEFERCAYFLLLFARAPDEFYWAVEQGIPREPDALRLAELEDFVERYGPDFKSVRLIPGGRYARAGARRYAPALFQAARQLAQSGGLARIREALGPFDSAGAQALMVEAEAWVGGRP